MFNASNTPDMRDEYEQVPNDLRSNARWCLWNYETSASRPKKLKVPYTVGGSRADTTQPSQFSPFDQVIKLRPKYSGIGVLLTPDDKFAGVDIDGCVTPGGNLFDYAEEIVADIDSYTEYSPSGTGIRILAATNWKPDPAGRTGAKSNGSEIYYSKRYLTITGKHLPGTPLEIKDRTKELKDLYDKLSGAKNQEDEEKTSLAKLGPAKILPDDFLANIRRRSSSMAGRIESEDGALAAGAETVEALYSGSRIRVDRSRNDMHIASWMSNHGYSKEDCVAVLTHPKWFSGSKSREVGNLSYARNTTINAYNATKNRVKRLPDAHRHYTELGNAERLIESYGNNIRHCKDLGGWMYWSGTCWVADDTRLVDRYLRETVRSLHVEAAAIADPDRSEVARKWAYRSEDHTAWAGTMTLAQTMEGITMPIASFDRHVWSFPAANGVVDLQTGELREHAREYYFTSTSPVAYDPDAKCPNWLAALELWLPDPELRVFVQRAAGYTISGSTSEQVLFFLYGAGHNGKTTFIQVLQHILGRFCKRITTEAITQQKGGSVGTLREQASARLAGARMGVVSEVERNMRLAEGWIKDITGGGAVATKVLYENPGEVIPTAKIWIDANHRPRVNSYVDESHAELDAFWRRFREIPFTAQVSAERRVKDYHNVLLTEEGSGILNWMVQGCMDWQLIGLPVPTAIKEANKDYREEVDFIRPFIHEWLTPDTQGAAPVKEVFMAYRRHCAEGGETPCSKKELKQRLQERGLVIGVAGDDEGWIGYRLAKNPYEYSF
jgi:putative DNA primase/helicase